MVYLCSRFPWPLDKGDKLRAYFQIVELSKYFRVILFCLSLSSISCKQKESLQAFCEEIHILKISRFWGFWRMVKSVGNHKPFQVALFYNTEAQNALNLLVERLLPRYYFAQMIRTAEYVRSYNIFIRTLDYMDALSAGMERHLPHTGRLLSPLVRSEFARLKSYEAEVFDCFECKTIISAQDRKAIFHPSADEIKIVPNGVAPQFFNATAYGPKHTDLIFTGNMQYLPNDRAALYIIREIMPLLDGAVSLSVIGKSPSRWLKSSAGKNITITGWVPDMAAALQSAKIMVAPMFSGSGLQNKLLEAMACGLPCVTTSLANNALGAKKDEEILIAEHPQEFARHIQHLLTDAAYAHKIGMAGKSYVQNNFNWENIGENLKNIIQGNLNK